MNTSEWAALAGMLFTAGGFFWGKGYGAGEMKKQLENVASTLELLNGEMENMQTNFQNCRLQSTQNTTKAQTAIDGVQSDIDKIAETEKEHFTEFIGHMGRRDVHTDSEWRAAIMSRLDRLSTSFDNRILAFEKVILDRISGLEKAVTNGRSRG